ncbi:MAG: 4-phosphoerythronate dehydrogenase [Rhodothermaceae bacterium]|nr:4-phosphoerythronate dehydrogenase [Rhodothermaceae bacterium]
MSPLRLLADINIPFAEIAFAGFGTVRTMPGRAITRADLMDTDVLLVRSATPVTAEWLRGTPVRFVGTATAGTDHVDTDAFAEAGIGFAAAPGSNAESVVEYVLAALLLLAANRRTGLRGKTLGVVGYGHVGSRVAQRAEALGLRVLPADPPLADAADARGEAHPFIPLEVMLDEADIITLHTPLTTAAESQYPTRHLISAYELERLKPEAWLLNAARGAVVDNQALADALYHERMGAAVLDVWEGEPAPDSGLARRVDIATPHIAGYSFDGKVEGTRMLEEALRQWLAAESVAPPAPWDVEAVLAPSPEESLVLQAPLLPDVLTAEAEARWLHHLTQQAYDLRADDARFRATVIEADPEHRGAAFQHIRKTYPRRRVWGRFTVRGDVPDAMRIPLTEGLGMQVAD